MPHDLLSFSDDNTDEENENPESFEGNGNPIDSYSFNSQETMFIPHTLTLEKVSIAPGEEEKNCINI